MISDFQGERQRVAYQISDALVFGWPTLKNGVGMPSIKRLTTPPSHHHRARWSSRDIRRIIAGQEDCRFAHVLWQAQSLVT